MPRIRRIKRNSSVAIDFNECESKEQLDFLFQQAISNVSNVLEAKTLINDYDAKLQLLNSNLDVVVTNSQASGNVELLQPTVEEGIEVPDDAFLDQPTEVSFNPDMNKVVARYEDQSGGIVKNSNGSFINNRKESFNCLFK